MAVFPCASGAKQGIRAKKALVRWRRGSTTDQRAIRAWWRRWPDALVGIDLAKSDLLVVDADRHGGPDEVVHWEELCVEHDWLIEQPVTLTPNSGAHTFFKQPTNGRPFGNSEGMLKRRGINFRGAGGYVIAPGSLLPDGRKYRTEPGAPQLVDALKEGAVPEVPAWLVALLGAKPARNDAASKPRPPCDATERERRYAREVLRREAEALRETEEGGRNDQLNRAAFSLGTCAGAGWIEEDEVKEALFDACIENGLISGLSDPYDQSETEFEATFRSGFSSGFSQPRAALAHGQVAEFFEAESGARRAIEQDGVIFDAETGEALTRIEASDGASEPSGGGEGDYVAEIMKRGGLVPDIMDYILANSRRPQRHFALAAALTVVATAAGRRLRTPTDSSLNLYQVLIVPTGKGKDTPLKAVSAIFKSAGLDRQMLHRGAFKSDVAIYLYVNRHPILTAIIDEFGDVVRAVNARGASTSSLLIMSTLRQFYDGGTLDAPAAACRKPITLIDPCLSLFCGSTPEQFYCAVGNTEARNGFLNRFLLIVGDDHPPRQEPDSRLQDVPSKISEPITALANYAGDRYRQLMDNPFCELETTCLPWADDAAGRAWIDYDAECEKACERDPRRKLYGPRCAQNAIRVATLLAIGENPTAPAVSAEHVRLAKLLVESFRR